MFYHAIVEVKEQNVIDTDIESLYEVIDDLVIPYLKEECMHFKGYFLEHEYIIRIAIK